MSGDGKQRPIRVLVVDDSTVTCTALTRLIESDPRLQVVGTAGDGYQALQKVGSLQPDVVTLDVAMPHMNGLETLKRIMQNAPRPVVMISALTREGAEITFEALQCGAFDYIVKPVSGSLADLARMQAEIVLKIKAAADSQKEATDANAAIPPDVCTAETSHPARVIAIGASTGGPKALQVILPCLPADLAATILVVQHMPPGFTGPFARRLDGMCRLSVREASNGDPIRPGMTYIAPAGVHMTVQRVGSCAFVRLSREPSDMVHIPSADIMMSSVARAFGPEAMGVILTGMGNDGALGMAAIREAGGNTVGQDESTCAIYGMPKACAQSGVLSEVLPLDRIAERILLATHQGRSVASSHAS